MKKVDNVVIKNLTPHAINVITEDGSTIATFAPEGVVARASQEVELVGSLNEIELVSMKFGATVDLPEPQEGTFLIVSVITVNAARAEGRTTSDLLMTADPVRDDEGQIIGCRRFSIQ